MRAPSAKRDGHAVTASLPYAMMDVLMLHRTCTTEFTLQAVGATTSHDHLRQVRQGSWVNMTAKSLCCTDVKFSGVILTETASDRL